MDRGFNPFVQKKIDDTVPARLSVKIISGMFITSKKTELMVEIEMYGLPADIVRRRFTKKRAPAPHPFWDEDYFVFKRVRGKGYGEYLSSKSVKTVALFDATYSTCTFSSQSVFLLIHFS